MAIQARVDNPTCFSCLRMLARSDLFLFDVLMILAAEIKRVHIQIPEVWKSINIENYPIELWQNEPQRQTAGRVVSKGRRHYRMTLF